jgi:hypothetical protein
MYCNGDCLNNLANGDNEYLTGLVAFLPHLYGIGIKE